MSARMNVDREVIADDIELAIEHYRDQLMERGFKLVIEAQPERTFFRFREWSVSVVAVWKVNDAVLLFKARRYLETDHWLLWNEMIDVDAYHDSDVIAAALRISNATPIFKGRPLV